MLSTTLHLQKSWLVVIGSLTLLSMLNLAWVPSKGLSFTFQITAITAVVIALTWLPALLRVFALVGGGIKTPVGEVTSSGLGTLAQSLDQETLGVLITRTARAEEHVSPWQQAEARQIRHELEEVYVSRIPHGQAHEQLVELMQRYKELRANMPPGSERTFQLEAVVGGMRALASQAGFSWDEVNAYLQSDDEGVRMAGLSIVEWSGNVTHFNFVLQIIDNPKSAFEQYHALSAMLRMSPGLDRTQKEQLREILNKQRNYNEAKKHWIKPGSDRWQIADRLLKL